MTERWGVRYEVRSTASSVSVVAVRVCDRCGFELRVIGRRPMTMTELWSGNCSGAGMLALIMSWCVGAVARSNRRRGGSCGAREEQQRGHDRHVRTEADGRPPGRPGRAGAVGRMRSVAWRSPGRRGALVTGAALDLCTVCGERSKDRRYRADRGRVESRGSLCRRCMRRRGKGKVAFSREWLSVQGGMPLRRVQRRGGGTGDKRPCGVAAI